MPPLMAPPMATPPARTMGDGSKAQARVQLGRAVQSLIDSLKILREVQSDEAKAILKALDALAKVTPDVDEGVSQSEVKAMLAGAETAMPGRGGAGSAPGMQGPIGPAGPRPMPMGAPTLGAMTPNPMMMG
jgi:hypothetical protein